MKNYIVADEWRIIEDGFNPEYNEISESLCSIGNGHMGQRANFEEGYSGKSLQGSYIGGVYYPDKTKVGWWKNGYPEYFAKVLNSTNWIGISVWIEEEEMDFATCITSNFRRELNMKEGYLLRTFDIEMPSGKMVRVSAQRFCSMADDETAAIRYAVTALNFTGMIRFQPYLEIWRVFITPFNSDSVMPDLKFIFHFVKYLHFRHRCCATQNLRPDFYCDSKSL